MWKKKRYLMVSLICLLLFIVVAELVRGGYTRYFDEFIRGLKILDFEFVIWLMIIMTEIASAEAFLLVTTLLLILFWMKGRRNIFLFFFTLSAGGVFMNFTLKMIYQRDRPNEAIDIEVFGNSLHMISYSFPSGHTMRGMILFMFLLYLSKYLSKKILRQMFISISLFSIISIPLSRIVLDVHFTSDILAAALISVGWFYGCLFLFEKKLKVVGR
ncbi:phosphatase PAP2 family protein [Halalkalibacter akibai]|uniref:Membrane-associated phospholipid phosphatase n=1 Tax=Halalkalibacter akibai (strain ATCC 43226 / DSM 21942 / CIP 109018 / JCM 9157 / 1139) TaxID=1236973 RepID=W4QN19_HALA3|nr:phosphatase PAP2 family protein [Halalkalibacter akibai]GAE33312.1 membrane-associated phospholipid phosphatase [Halalkalibacter akibai JCM 9157]